MSDLVERVAAAFVPMFQKNADGYGRDETDPDGQGELWIRPTELAELALAALSEAGLAIVPADLATAWAAATATRTVRLTPPRAAKLEPTDD